MARQLISEEQWKEARILWESDDKISYGDVAKKLSISKQAVGKKAKVEGWQRKMNLQKVAAEAYRQADRKSVEADLSRETFAASPSKGASGVDVPTKKEVPPESVEAEPVDASLMTSEERAEAEAVRKRAEILARHRQEAMTARANIYASMQKKDFELGKVAKINAEALQIVQNLERKAWGLDSVPQTGENVVIIERG